MTSLDMDLDETAVYLTTRRRRPDGLSAEERIAINLLWRRKVRVPVIAEIYGVSKNTIYYKALTGYADSYPTTKKSNSAAETNAIIDALGEEEAWRRFVPQKIIKAVNEANRKEAARRRKG